MSEKQNITTGQDWTTEISGQLMLFDLESEENKEGSGGGLGEGGMGDDVNEGTSLEETNEVESLEEVFQNGTLAMGFIGLSETIELLTGEKFISSE